MEAAVDVLWRRRAAASPSLKGEVTIAPSRLEAEDTPQLAGDVTPFRQPPGPLTPSHGDERGGLLLAPRRRSSPRVPPS